MIDPRLALVMIQAGIFFKLEFIGEIDMCTFLSVAKEKYQKNRHLRKVPRYFP